MPLELPLDEPLLEDWVELDEDELAGVDELEELDPQAATASAANTSRAAAQLRGDLSFMGCIIALLFSFRESEKGHWFDRRPSSNCCSSNRAGTAI
jgi:hypothetical protein